MMEFFSIANIIAFSIISSLIYLLFVYAKKTTPTWIASGRSNHKRRPSLLQVMEKEAPATNLSYLVIGTGQVGLSLVDALLARGETKVKGFDLKEPRRGVANEEHFTFIKGDVHDTDALNDALEGVDVVFSTFAIIRFYERLKFQYAESYHVNIAGTEKVIAACKRKNVKFLVQTSSCTVNLTPNASGFILDETAPYVTHSNAFCHYALTKAESEKLVLSANGTATSDGGTLYTAAARPAGIFGPEDNTVTEPQMTNGSHVILVAGGGCDYVYIELYMYSL